jgi:hypothetical protein
MTDEEKAFDTFLEIGLIEYQANNGEYLETIGLNTEQREIVEKLIENAYYFGMLNFVRNQLNKRNDA